MPSIPTSARFVSGEARENEAAGLPLLKIAQPDTGSEITLGSLYGDRAS